jgi:hypothetical protein
MALPARLEHETEREFAWRVYPDDARVILRVDQTRTSQCKQPLCRAQIWWGMTAANERRCPFDVKPDGTRTGTSHWRTCRQRPEKKGA